MDKTLLKDDRFAGQVEESELLNQNALENKQYRRYFVTQLNPQDYGLESPDVLKRKLEHECKCKYCCFCYENAPTTGTRHFHLYIEYFDGRKFSTIYNMFPHAHIQVARGDIMDIRDYISKSGKYAGTEAAEHNDRLTFREIGAVDSERKRKSNGRNIHIMEDLKKGRNPLEILDENPELIFKNKQLSELAQSLRFDQVPHYREVETIYICGDTGLGKTKMIYDENDPKDVCRITSYPKRSDVKFDCYSGQRVLVFEEFRSQVDISSMLNYLDNYKIWLPARYSDRVSAYDKVYITSNWRLDEQYRNIKATNPLTWKAFIRRIDKVRILTGKGEYAEFRVKVDKDFKLVYEMSGNNTLRS